MRGIFSVVERGEKGKKLTVKKMSVVEKNDNDEWGRIGKIKVEP